MPINRREIPPLQSQCRPEFTPVIVARSYSFGRGDPMRICRGKSLTVWVQVHSHHARKCRVRFFNTLDDRLDERPHYEECHRGDDGLFVCFFVPMRTGAFVFRASYSLDDGKSWTFDEVPYTWLVADPPAFNDIRMYTLIPTASQHIGHWRMQLDRIKQLGCNAVHLLPLTFMDCSESPYSAHDLFSLDPSYLIPGDPRDGLDQWEEFVEYAKSLGMRLCIDLVLNHVGVTSLMAQQKPEWILPDPAQSDGLKRAGCFTGAGWLTWEDLVLLNYANPDDNQRDSLWAYMSEYAMFWANYASYTGGMVRFDNLHSSNPQFVSMLTRALRRKFPDLTLLAEFFGDENTLARRSMEWDLDLLLATPWDYKFVPELRRYFKDLHRQSDQVRFLVPISSHDSGTPTQEFWNVNATYPRYAVSALLSFGATGLSQGVEWGLDRKINFIGRNAPLVQGESEEVFGFIYRVNEILRKYQAFHLTQNCQFVDENHVAIIAAVRRDSLRPFECFLVAANFDGSAAHSLDVESAALLDGEGEFCTEELISGGQPTVCSTSRLRVELGPCQVQVLRCRRERRG